MVGWVSFAAALVAIGALVACVVLQLSDQRRAEAEHARNQRFVDTATQMVVNMFSYKQDTIDESVNRFYDSTSGPLRGMLSANNAVENLKSLFRTTNATSEAVINGAAMEAIDTVTDNASVLVSVRVTVADIDGVNKPSMPYRLRVIVHEDEQGRMTGYDLKYPNGGTDAVAVAADRHRGIPIGRVHCRVVRGEWMVLLGTDADQRRGFGAGGVASAGRQRNTRGFRLRLPDG